MAEQKKEKMVTIHLFRDTERYKDDVIVGLNGKMYQIKRGMDVEVPEAVAEIIENSRKQDQQTADMIEQKQAEFNKARSRLE